MITKYSLDDKYLEGLPSVGPSTKLKLNSIGIRRISDVILFLPSFLIDKTIASPIGQIFTGNPNIIEDKPIYGPVKANRNQGDYRQALNLVEAQLKKHPFDFDGLMLKAAIQAEDYHDLNAAKETLDIALTDKDQKRYNYYTTKTKI